MTLEIVNNPIFVTLQDKGRYGYSHIGVTNSGVMDEYAYLVAGIPVLILFFASIYFFVTRFKSIRPTLKKIKNADIVILDVTVNSLSMGFVLHHALELGKPVIASRLKAVENYFGEGSLVYFQPADPQSLANSIIDLYHHPEKRRTLARNARELYGKYCWAQQKEVYLSVYQNILQ